MIIGQSIYNVPVLIYLLETEIFLIVEFQLKCCSVADDAVPDFGMVMSGAACCQQGHQRVAWMVACLCESWWTTHLATAHVDTYDTDNISLFIYLFIYYVSNNHVKRVIWYTTITCLATSQYWQARDLGELLDRFLRTPVTSVDDVDTVRERISNVLLHKAAETTQVRADAGNSHHRTFR